MPMEAESSTIFYLKLENQESWGCKSQPKFEGQKTRRVNVEGRRRWMTELKKREGKCSLLVPFFLFRSSTNYWMKPTCVGKGALYSVYQ